MHGHLHVTVEGGGRLAAVRDPVDLRIYGGQPRGWRRGAMGVALNPGQEDACEGGLRCWMNHQRRRES